MSDAPGASLSVSIVVYFPEPSWLTTTLETLVAALAHARHAGAMRRAKICLVDNQATSSTSSFSTQLEKLCSELGWIETTSIAGQGNIGYGRANNLAIARGGDCEFQLVLNPDVELAEDAITNALRYLQQHLDWIRRFFRGRLDAYERKETAFDAGLIDAKIVSGCFMLIRRTALARTEGFDPAFFLYFEDFDLSYRISKFSGIARVADVRIVHAGGSAAAKGWRHVWLFVGSALRFHRKHG